MALTKGILDEKLAPILNDLVEVLKLLDEGKDDSADHLMYKTSDALDKFIDEFFIDENDFKTINDFTSVFITEKQKKLDLDITPVIDLVETRT